MKVRKSMAQRFIDWFPGNTKLYLRGERGADWAKADRLYRELASQLQPFLESIVRDEIDRLAENERKADEG